MKTLAIILLSLITVSCYSQRPGRLPHEEVHQTYKGDTVKTIIGTDTVHFDTNMDFFNFKGPLLVNGVPIAGAYLVDTMITFTNGAYILSSLAGHLQLSNGIGSSTNGLFDITSGFIASGDARNGIATGYIDFYGTSYTSNGRIMGYRNDTDTSVYDAYILPTWEGVRNYVRENGGGTVADSGDVNLGNGFMIKSIVPGLTGGGVGIYKDGQPGVQFYYGDTTYGSYLGDQIILETRDTSDGGYGSFYGNNPRIVITPDYDMYVQYGTTGSWKKILTDEDSQPQSVQIEVTTETLVSGGDSVYVLTIPENLAGMNLIKLEAYPGDVTGDRTMSVKAYRKRSTTVTTMTSTGASFTVNATINTSYDDVQRGDKIAIGWTFTGGTTSPVGLTVNLTFQKP